jgi:uncharacterized protein DUF5985
MDALLAGGIGVAALAAGLFFLRFWRQTRDRFFLFFCVSFWIEGAHRVLLFYNFGHDEATPLAYVPRLVAYGLIIAAIIDKNRHTGKPPRE